MMDNGLMILFGDAIETHIGAVLTISTMACAAIGNWLSDLVGVLSGSTVEKLAQRCGLPHHGLSLEQLETPTAFVLMRLSRVRGRYTLLSSHKMSRADGMMDV